ncbi:MAG: DUF1772 domain-containing protein [Actinomycetota bacterium]|nr:DUF1772 domain-containing protein [Actinomycetota bacterium]
MQALLHAAHPATIVLTGVLAGAVLTTWLSEASLGATPELWIGYHQAITPAYTRALPPLGGLALIAALAALAASWGSPRDRRLILTAVACLLIGLVITVVVHFPINAEIATWLPAAPPTDWQQIRDRWLAAHVVRTALSVAAFTLLVTSGPRHRGAAR